MQKLAPGEPRRLEAKAVVAYADREERGGRVRHVGAVHHAAVGAPFRFMQEVVAAVGCRYDLPKVRRAYVGADGAPRSLPREPRSALLLPRPEDGLEGPGRVLGRR